jgi:hypothetical protein
MRRLSFARNRSPCFKRSTSTILLSWRSSTSRYDSPYRRIAGTSGPFVMTRGRNGTVDSLVRLGLTLVHEADLDCALLVSIEFAEVDVELMTALPRNTSHAAQEW